MTGRIKSINRERGFLFITAEDGHDYFAHRSDVERSAQGGFEDLDEDATVAFEPVEPVPVKGLRASAVKAVATSNAA